MNGYAFTNFAEAQKVADALREAKSFRKVDYDWNKLGSNFKYLEKKENYTFNDAGDFSVNETHVYSNKLYASIVDFAAQNKAMNEQVEKDMKSYDDAYAAASAITLEIRGRVTEIREKYERLERLTCSFANDYYPLSDNNEEMAMKFMSKAFTLTGEEEKYILENYKDNL